MSKTLPIALTRLLEENSAIKSVLEILTHMTTMLFKVCLRSVDGPTENLYSEVFLFKPSSNNIKIIF